jgi:hypothetical protein
MTHVSAAKDGPLQQRSLLNARHEIARPFDILLVTAGSQVNCAGVGRLVVQEILLFSMFTNKPPPSPSSSRCSTRAGVGGAVDNCG